MSKNRQQSTNPAIVPGQCDLNNLSHNEKIWLAVLEILDASAIRLKHLHDPRKQAFGQRMATQLKSSEQKT